MKWHKLLSKEFAEIIKSKKILIPIIAVLFVPILYAGMFLWAFWDPYEQLDDLPVAVVNLDKGAELDGKPIEVGKGLVDNLKDNKSFKWEFVSEKEAKEGMEGRKYYMLVRIPDDFSSNATTLLKDDPKPLNLEYIPNESLNFLSSQIGGTAIEKIKGEVSSTLTKTYAEKMFDSIKDVSKGLADGAEGANKLHDGASELHEGSGKVTDGLYTLQGKSGEMKDGVQKLADGSNKLQDGSGKVTDGLNTLNSKTGEMQTGIGKLQDGSGKVTDGLNTLSSKTGEMQTGIGKLQDGSGKVTAGLNTLNSKTGEMQKGIDELQGGSENVTGGLNKLVSKSDELKTGTTELSNGMEQLVGGQSELEKGSQEIQTGLQELNSKVQNSVAGLEKAQSNIPSILNTVNEKMTGAEENVNQLNEFTQSTAGDATTAAQDVANLQKQIESLPKEYQEQLQPFIANAAKSTATVQQKAAGVAGGTNKLNEEVKQLKGEIHQTTSGLQNKLPNPAEVKNLTEGIEKLTNEQTKFVSKFHGFGEGLANVKIGADKLKDGSGQLIDGVTQLQSGSGKVTAGLGQLSVGANQMSGGVTQLVDGSSQVTGGLGTLSAGANQMSGGINQLADGSNQVTGGLGTLSVGASQMTGGITQLADGSGQVTTGLGTLNGGLNKMSTGSTQLIDGVNKLADGSGKVTDGLVKVNDGSGTLAEKLGEGAEKTGEVKGTDKTYDMFASPVKVKTEKMAEVPNYGTGFTPYFLSLGLFVGALLLSIVYPLRDTVGVPKSGFNWFISKFGVLLSVGIIQAIVADVILLFWLGVEVQSIPYFILFSIVTSLAFISLIQCLVTAFGDAGRFIAIITLIIQLTTSAGTFPLELIPKYLQPFNAWLPMTYSVSGLKAVVSSGDFNFMWQNIGILMIFIVVLSLGTIASLTWMHKRQFKNIAENQSIEA
ncbi:YhgE/Pip domain-containing protein [Bacillus mycoides]|uniref:YhgE/Pip domain-containing protein n=1 Tax=Bacillus mycoides TaxID=1405 RepID=UPI0010BF518F|nr:YhgE/Pip domain-containing protein [Bacillus mycoides]MED1285881.1 YhgE/Pip domain-containing protein [Bacillus mycoides]TKI51024.1 YhgE/Pip domain-containing protein [Bacillus mycoides]